MAINSKKLPITGLGASLVGALSNVSQQTPATAIKEPIQVERPTRSLSSQAATSATMTGSMAVIMPAWEAVVFSRALASNRK